jgi:hypothetical protein
MRKPLALAAALFVPCALEIAAVAEAPAPPIAIVSVAPTSLFPRPPAGEALRRIVRIELRASEAARAVRVRLFLDGKDAGATDLGPVAAGASKREILVPDADRAVEARLEVFLDGRDAPAAAWTGRIEPARKWKVYCVSYSHHDLGFGNYPHRLRTDIRHGNIERPLRFCTETDGWEEDSKFRFVIETCEPITSFLGTHSEADARELARRVREGRIQVGAIHSTVNTEQLGHELLARLFYLGGRHVPDLLGVPPGRTALLDDVIGVTWPFATFAKEAGVPFFFHGHNLCGRCLRPASLEPVFYWQGPDGDTASKVLVRSTFYGGYAGDAIGDLSEGRVEGAIAALGPSWPYDALLLQDGTDFALVTMDAATRIRAWNGRYAWPRLICATLDQFFDAVAAGADPAKVKTFAKDGNNQWADQDASDAWLLGKARRLGEEIPTAEKFSTVAMSLSAGGYPWTSIYEAYHRLLLYHEHTDAAAGLGRGREAARYYETELVEDREMVIEAEERARSALDGALGRIAGLVATASDRSLVVFNPLARPRTDAVLVTAADLAGLRVVDAATGRERPLQALPDGTAAFVAEDVPSLGYRTYSLVPGGGPRPGPVAPAAQGAIVLESPFYRAAIDPARGGISSLRDRELDIEMVDPAAPHLLGEYLYERFESPRFEDGTRWHRVESAKVSVERGPVADVAVVEGKAAGVEGLRETIVLWRDLKRIDFALDLVKSPSGRDWRSRGAAGKESVYAALPFAVPGFRAHHELPGAVVEPIRDQFEGSCTAYHAARHFADVSSDRFGVTVASPEASLVEYGRPRSCPIPPGREGDFEMKMEYPATSRIYLYLMDNMFDVNIRWDQRGPARFTWSIRSHPGDWRAGRADAFGWDVLNPLVARRVEGKRAGTLPPSSSFLEIDRPGVECLTVKPAEANGAGFVLRLHETRGEGGTAGVRLPFLGPIAAAVATSLVEVDRPEPLAVDGDRIAVPLRPFGVRTLRVIPREEGGPPAVAALEARPVSDREVDLSWKVDPAGAAPSHFHVYRGTRPDFERSLLALVGRPAATAWRDAPRLAAGGWIHERVEPSTAYWYRAAAVDRRNREGPLSTAVAATTLRPGEGARRPSRVEGLRAIPVGPLHPENFVTLLFRTAVESDIRRYEVHRSTSPGFEPSDATRIGVADPAAVIPGSGAYGHVQVDHRAGEYDHQMFDDDTVAPATTYFYLVRAVDKAGRAGPFSDEASARTEDPLPPPNGKATASSVYAPEYPPENAIDGDPDPYAAWISKPYGGGAREAPRDAWLVVELRRKVRIAGVKVYGDEREVIPIARAFRVDVREAGAWRTVAEMKGAASNTVTVPFAAEAEVEAVRVYVPAADLPRSSRADVDGIARVCELALILPGEKEVSVPDLPREP